MSSQLEKLERMMRKVIREEIAEAIPVIVESIQPRGGLIPPPNQPSRADSTLSVRDLLERTVGWEDGPPGPPSSQFLPAQAPVGHAPSQGLLTPGQGGFMPDGRAVPPINENNKVVYEAINTNYSDLMKKLNLV